MPTGPQDKTLVMPRQVAATQPLPDNPLRSWVHTAYPFICWSLILLSWWAGVSAAFFEKFEDQSGVRLVAIVIGSLIGIFQLVFGIILLARIRIKPKLAIFLGCFGAIMTFFDAQFLFSSLEGSDRNPLGLIVSVIEFLCFCIVIYMFSSVEGFAEE
jgi:hypothetical protein